VKVLVTGANGFVGRSVVKRLVAEGDSVIAAVGPGSPGHTQTPNVTTVSLDLENDASLSTVVATPVDAVVHLAAIALSRAAEKDPSLAWRVNAEGTAKLAAALARAAQRWSKPPLFLLASTADVYAWQTHAITEKDRVQPSTPYAWSKLGAEIATQQTGRCTGLPFIIARPFPHSGGGQDDKFWIPQQANLLRVLKRVGGTAIKVGDLTAVRDYLHVDDVADAYALLLKRGTAGEVYNIASGQEVTLDAIHTRLEHLLDLSVKREVDPNVVRKGARPYLVGDATKLRTATGWSPRRSLDDTLKDVLDAQTN